MNKAIFLDRDGTINVDKGYVYKVEDFEYIDGALEALEILQKAGFKLVVITNQSGISRGYYTEDDYYKLNQWMLNDLRRNGINLAGTYFCPHLPSGVIVKYAISCNCRKPGIDLFIQAARELNINLNSSYAVGDNIRDLCICEKYPVSGVLLSNITNAYLPNCNGKKIVIKEKLYDAANYIKEAGNA